MLKKSRDIQGVDASGVRDRGDRGNSTRYFINIGEKDGYDWMSLKDFLKESLNLGTDAVSRVEVKEKFGFFNTDTEHKDKVLEVFENYTLDGRKVNIEISENRGGGRGRRNGGGGGGRGRGGFRGDRRNSGDRKDNGYKGKREGDRGDRGSGGGAGRDRRKRKDRY